MNFDNFIQTPYGYFLDISTGHIYIMEDNFFTNLTTGEKNIIQNGEVLNTKTGKVTPIIDNKGMVDIVTNTGELIDQKLWNTVGYWGNVGSNTTFVGGKIVQNGGTQVMAAKSLFLPYKTYKVTATVTCVSGYFGIAFTCGGTYYAIDHLNASGTYIGYVNTTDDTSTGIYSYDFVGSIDALSIKEVSMPNEVYLPLTSTGNGTGVATLKLTTSETFILKSMPKIGGWQPILYTDAECTQSIGTICSVSSGAERTAYVRVPNGYDCYLYIPDATKITSWGDWISGTNAPSIGGSIEKFINTERLYISGNNTLYGNISVLTKAVDLGFGGNTTVSGDISNLTFLETIYVTGTNTLYGNLDGLSLTWIGILGNNAITTNLKYISNILTEIYLLGNSHVTEYTAGGNWSNISEGASINIQPATDYGLSGAEVDLLLQEIASTKVGGRAINVELTGSNAARTVNSDVAVATILADGGTVTTNGGSPFRVTSSGNGTGVGRICINLSAGITLTLDGAARFYTDAAATLGESTTWTPTSGTYKIAYIRVPSGSSNLWFSDGSKVTKWGDNNYDGWIYAANGPILSGDITKLTALTAIYINTLNTISGNIALLTGLTYCLIGGDTTISGSVNDLTSLTTLNVSGSNTISGSIAGLTGLTYLYAYGSNTISGSISGLTRLTRLEMSGNNTISGNVNALTELTYVGLFGLNTVSGDIKYISDGLEACTIAGNDQVADYTSGGNWSGLTAEATVRLYGNIGYGLSSAEIDLLLQEIAATKISGRAVNVTLQGSNAARTAISDAAVNAIIADGGTVTTNASPSVTPSSTPSITPSVTITPSITVTPSITPSASPIAEQWYGYELDEANSSPDVTRIAGSGNMGYHASLPIQSLMKGCVINDSGVVQYYLKADDWSKKLDNSSSNLDGTDGQLMVEVPKFYHKIENPNAGVYQHKFSLYPISGFVEIPKFYVSSSEAQIQRSTLKLTSVRNLSTDYRGGDNNAAWDALDKTLLGKPASVISLTNFRTYARNRGSNKWNVLPYRQAMLLYDLFICEYATLNSQKAVNGSLTGDGYKQGGLGNGVTEFWISDAYNGYYPIIPCGQSDSLANGSGEVNYVVPGGSGYTVNVPRFRGIENIFGHLWEWQDGVSIYHQTAGEGGLHKFYTCDLPANFADNTASNYDYRSDLPEEGWLKTVTHDAKGILIPKTVGGNSDTYFGDYYYTPATGAGYWVGVLRGGYAYYGSFAGFVSVYSGLGASVAGTIIGSRFCYLP